MKRRASHRQVCTSWSPREQKPQHQGESSKDTRLIKGSRRPQCHVYNGWRWFSVALRPQRRVGLLGTGTEWEGGERVKGSTAETARKRPERPWTAARTMEVLRRCPLAIAQRLVHRAIALSTAVLDRVTTTMSVAPLLNWRWTMHTALINNFLNSWSR